MHSRRRSYTSILLLLFLGVGAAQAEDAQRQVDPTFLHRNLASAAERPSDVTTPSCHYKPLFGERDPQDSALAGIARFGEVTLDTGGSCAEVSYTGEDQIYFVLDGSGSLKYAEETIPLRKHDYVYLPATISHSLRGDNGGALSVIAMGFRTKGYPQAPMPPHALKANMDDVQTQPVSGHPSSALYRLLMGDVSSKRDRIAAGRVMTSLFIMEIAPGGTNFPHHHEREEEIYLVLDGHGEMVAGGGLDGVEGRHPAQAGDAYFFRLNCTVGYYSAPDAHSRILAVRSWYPGMALAGMEH